MACRPRRSAQRGSPPARRRARRAAAAGSAPGTRGWSTSRSRRTRARDDAIAASMSAAVPSATTPMTVLGRGVDVVERLAALALAELSVDQQPALAGLRRGLGHDTTRAGTCFQPATLVIATRLQPAMSTSNLRHEVQHHLQCDPALHPRECGTEAAVDPVAETDVDCLVARPQDVELVGVRERPLVAVGRARDDEHRVVGRDLRRRAARRPWCTNARRTAPAPGSAAAPRPPAAPGSRSSSSICHWSGFWWKATAALPISLVTVSAPAPPSRLANAVISTSSSLVTVPSSRSTSTSISRRDHVVLRVGAPRLISS